MSGKACTTSELHEDGYTLAVPVPLDDAVDELVALELGVRDVDDDGV